MVTLLGKVSQRKVGMCEFLVIPNVDPFCGGTRRIGPVCINFTQNVGRNIFIIYFMNVLVIQNVDLFVRQIPKGVSRYALSDS